MSDTNSAAANDEPESLVYRAFGVGMLEYMLPTAATAGLLNVIAHVIDGVNFESGFEPKLLLGVFTALLFVVSTGQWRRHNDQRVDKSIAFDLAESICMVAAFHFLGLVTDYTSASEPAYFFALSLYLACILGRRWTNRDRKISAVATAAESPIVVLSWVTFVGALIFAIYYFLESSKLSDQARYVHNLSAGILLCIALAIYIWLVWVRELKVSTELKREKQEQAAKNANAKPAGAAGAEGLELPKVVEVSSDAPAPIAAVKQAETPAR